MAHRIRLTSLMCIIENKHPYVTMKRSASVENELQFVVLSILIEHSLGAAFLTNADCGFPLLPIKAPRPSVSGHLSRFLLVCFMLFARFPLGRALWKEIATKWAWEYYSLNRFHLHENDKFRLFSQRGKCGLILRCR